MFEYTSICMEKYQIIRMEYRYLGPTGLRVSVIGFGNWVNSNKEDQKENTAKCVKVAFEAGVNFFDTAEIYGHGEAERQMGEALLQLKAPREQYVLSTKLWRDTSELKPNRQGLSRKHLIQGIKKSLKNLKHDHVDVVFAHRPDYVTPMEETCRAFDWIITKGLAHYWGTSEWAPADIQEAHVVCSRLGLTHPVVEQPQYNLLNRSKFECQFKRLFQKTGMGTTIWSPLCGGFLTGKYSSGEAKEGSRYSTEFFKKRFNDLVQGGGDKDETLKKLRLFDDYAKQLGVASSQLAIAWCLFNKDVSVALTGATHPDQLVETLKAVQFLKKYTPEIDLKIESIFENFPKVQTSLRTDTSRRAKYSGYIPK